MKKSNSTVVIETSAMASPAPGRESGVTFRAFTGRARLVKATLALVSTVAVVVGAIVVPSGDRHPGLTSGHPPAASVRSHPNTGRLDPRLAASQADPGANGGHHTDCVVTITDATICGSSAAQYCNLVISRSLPQGPAATGACVRQIRQFNRERSRAYELNEESSEPLPAISGDS